MIRKSKISKEYTSQNSQNKEAKKVKTKKTKPAKKYSTARITGLIIASCAVIAIVCLMISSQVKITELTEQVTKAQTQLAEEQSEYTQLTMRVEASLSLDQVNDYATKKLGMTPTENYQIQYINMETGDSGEVVENDKSWFKNIKSALSAWLS